MSVIRLCRFLRRRPSCNAALIDKKNGSAGLTDAAFLEKESRGLVFGAVNSVTEGTRNSPEHQYGRSTDQNINDPA